MRPIQRLRDLEVEFSFDSLRTETIPQLDKPKHPKQQKDLAANTKVHTNTLGNDEGVVSKPVSEAAAKTSRGRAIKPRQILDL